MHRNLLYFQLILTALIALLSGGILFSFKVFYSALLGGGIPCLSGFIFYIITAYGKASEPRNILATFYIGEIIKLLSLASLFTLSLIWIPLHPVFFILSFVAVQSTPLIFPIFYSKLSQYV